MKSRSTLLIKLAFLILFYISFTFAPALAQMKVGQLAGPPDGSAALDVNGGPYSTGSPFRGIVPPKVALTNITSANPVTKPAIGLLVFNTAKVGDLTPGYYYWEGSKWLRFTTASSGSARLSVNGQYIPAYLMNQVSSLSAPDIIYIADAGREGMFRYDPTSTVSPDNAMVLAASTGRYLRIWDGYAVNVAWFGVKGDGVADDGTALNNAFAYCSARGLTVNIPSGIYQTSVTLQINTVNLLGTTSNQAGRRIRIQGAGRSTTVLRYTGNQNVPLLRVRGNKDDQLNLDGFRLTVNNPVQTPSLGVGLDIANLANAEVSNVGISYFELGLKFNDVGEGLWRNLVIEYCNRGAYGAPDQYGLAPNANKFLTCHFNSNSTYGIFIENGCNNSFDTCTFLDNAGVSTTNGWAIKLQYAGFNGGNSGTITNCYMEANRGKVVYIVCAAGGAHTIEGTSFNRNGNQFPIYDIYFEPLGISAGGPKNMVSLISNSHNNYAMYDTCACRPTIAFGAQTPYDGWVVAENDYFANEPEKPVYGNNVTLKYENFSKKRRTAVWNTATFSGGAINITNSNSNYIYIDATIGASAVTSIIGGEVGDIVYFVSGASVSFTHRAETLMAGMVSYTLTPEHLIQMRKVGTNSWKEITRN